MKFEVRWTEEAWDILAGIQKWYTPFDEFMDRIAKTAQYRSEELIKPLLSSRDRFPGKYPYVGNHASANALHSYVLWRGNDSSFEINYFGLRQAEWMDHGNGYMIRPTHAKSLLIGGRTYTGPRDIESIRDAILEGHLLRMPWVHGMGYGKTKTPETPSHWSARTVGAMSVILPHEGEDYADHMFRRMVGIE